jgi:dipeptidyl aminopeptidase/acylaminoacyl peptidase
MARVAPFGSWTSSITAAAVSRSGIRLVGCVFAAGRIWWLEGRPAEGGRHVLVTEVDGAPVDVTPTGFNVRSRVHEYGGGGFLVGDDALYFSNDGDGRVYRQTLASDGSFGLPEPITDESRPRALRFADFLLDAGRARLIAVCEDHRGDGEASNSLVALPLAGGELTVLASGRDFYASPQLDAEGGRLCFLAWDHPELPFLATELFEATVAADGTLQTPRLVAGAERASVVQPRYTPDGRLSYFSDRQGYADLYCDEERVLSLEVDLAPPLWRLGGSSYAFVDATHAIMIRCEGGMWRLMRVDLAAGTHEDLALPYTAYGSLHVSGNELCCLAGGPRHSARVVRLNLDSGAETVVRESSSMTVPDGLLSEPESITFPTTDDTVAHAFFYPPKNVDFEGIEGELPPLIVKAHGGPTSAAGSSLDPRIQFWTSRGFGVVDVNYRGSTGYGRGYRDALQHRWGIVDVDDCVAAARHLVSQRRADGERLVITGGSAGGYTTLAALAFRDVFRAGASHYGVSDLEALMADTHKFESRYDVYLIAPDATGKRADPVVMKERSPIHAADRLACPVIFIQGLEDRVVPPNQAERMVAALDEKGIAVAYVPFEGEQHGFLKAENIARALEAELYFYAAVLGFALGETIEPVTIRNAESLPAVRAVSDPPASG